MIIFILMIMHDSAERDAIEGKKKQNKKRFIGHSESNA